MNVSAYDMVLAGGRILRNQWFNKELAESVHTILSSGGDYALYKHKKYGEILDDILGKDRTVKNTIKFLTSYTNLSNVKYIVVVLGQILNNTETYDKYYRIKRRYMKHLLELSKDDGMLGYMIAYALIYSRVPFVRKMVFHKIIVDLNIDAVLGIIGLLKKYPKYIFKAINKDIIPVKEILTCCWAHDFSIRYIKAGIKKYGSDKHLKYYYTSDYTRKSLYCFNKYGRNIELNPNNEPRTSRKYESLGFMILSRRYQGMEILDNSKVIHRISTMLGSMMFRKNLTKLSSYYV